jgi:hypothetical protein
VIVLEYISNSSIIVKAYLLHAPYRLASRSSESFGPDDLHTTRRKGKLTNPAMRDGLIELAQETVAQRMFSFMKLAPLDARLSMLMQLLHRVG